MIFAIFSIVISGLIIGGLGRLVVPGPNPIGLMLTSAIGIVSALIGWSVARAIWVFPSRHEFLTIVIEVVIAALLVSLVSRGRMRSIYRR